ncbi:MAG: hypothetical protein DHS20C15_15810 [Planctomycetota bacterium]|nr:MAG: hypothetical protein DHS20C15_15810 [Planctomycetota bacterium]
MAASFESSTTIHCSPDAVFALATDFQRVSEWMPGVTQLEPLDEGPVRKGWRFKETRSMKGRQVSAVIEVIEHHGPAEGAPPYKHAARSSVMGVEGVYTFSFAALDGDKTAVQLRAEVRATSFLAKPLVGLAAKAMKKQDGDMLAKLKALCEAEC